MCVCVYCVLCREVHKYFPVPEMTLCAFVMSDLDKFQIIVPISFHQL